MKVCAFWAGWKLRRRLPVPAHWETVLRSSDVADGGLVPDFLFESSKMCRISQLLQTSAWNKDPRHPLLPVEAALPGQKHRLLLRSFDPYPAGQGTGRKNAESNWKGTE